MISLKPAATRPIILRPAADSRIVIEPVNANLPSPAIRLLARPPGPPGPAGPPIDPDDLGDGLIMVGEEIRIDINSLTAAV